MAIKMETIIGWTISFIILAALVSLHILAEELAWPSMSSSDEWLCDQALNPLSTLDVSQYFTAAFITLLVFDWISLCILLKDHLCKRCTRAWTEAKTEYYTTLWVGLWAGSMALALEVFATGIFFYRGNLNKSCKESTTGNMMLAFAIISIVFSLSMWVVCWGTLKTASEDRKRAEDTLSERLNPGDDAATKL